MTYNECRTPTRVADRERRADNMTTPSARRRRNPARQESPSPERVRDTPMLDDPFVQQMAQMQNNTDASIAAVSDLRAQLAALTALTVPQRATTRGRPRGTTASRAVTDPNPMQQASDSSRGRGGSRGRGRGRPPQTRPAVNPNYKMALQPTSVLLQQVSVHYLGQMDVACPDCNALHWGLKSY